MNTRNKISLVLISLFIVGATLSTLITVKDINQIISDFNNFSGVQPPTWGGNSATPLGSINLYITGNASAEAEPILQIQSNGIPQPQIPEIYHVYLTIEKISIKHKNTGDFKTILKENKVVDLLSINDTAMLLSNTTVVEGNYSAIRLELSNEITVISSEGQTTFWLQGKNIIILSFYRQKGYPGEMVDLQVQKQKNSEVFLDVNVQLLWHQRIATQRIGAYLSMQGGQ